MFKKSKKNLLEAIIEGPRNNGGVNPPPSKPKPDVIIYGQSPKQNKVTITIN